MKNSGYFFILLMSSFVFLKASSEGGPEYIDYFIAVKSLDLLKVKECIENNKIDVNMTDGAKCTALHHLALLKNKKKTKDAKKIMNFFLEKGVDTRINDELDNNAVRYAIFCKNISLVKKIVTYERKKKYPNLSLNMPNKKGATPFLLAASVLETKDFFKLLNWGGDIATKTTSGWSLVHAALKRNKYDFAAQLIRLGAPFLEKNKKGNCPIDLLESKAMREKFIKALVGYSPTLKPATQQKALSYYELLLKGDNKMPQQIGFDKVLYTECKKEISKLKSAQKSQGL